MPLVKKFKTVIDTSAIFATCFLITDIVTIFGSFLLAYLLRNSLGIRGDVNLPSFGSYLIYCAAFTLTWIIVFWLGGLYRRDKISHGAGGLPKIIGSISSGATLIIIYFFLNTTQPFSRLIIIYAVVLSLILVPLGRYWMKFIRQVLRKRGIGTRRVIFYTNGEQSLKAIRDLKGTRARGEFEVLGVIGDKKNELLLKETSFKFLGTPLKLKKILTRLKPDILVLTAPKKASEILNLDDFCRNKEIEFRFVPDTPRLLSQYSLVANIGGVPVFGIKNPAILGWGRVAKRILDFIFSVGSLVIISPILILTALIIKITDWGPVFYKQERYGRDGKIFAVYKFRSMRPEADKVAKWTVKNDPRITKIGKIIRKTSIDELPQLINVLKGEMSVVGPRPEQPKFVEEFSKTIPRYHYRHRIKGGITGWAQVNGLRGDTSIEERVRYDLYYIENWTILFDIKIIFLTIKTVLFRPGHTN
jgi:exopolysaccharide biosynthesis polyprenyl glycosylphosphotransferase